MLNKKRLKNLSLIKQKKLMGQKVEITTLDNEFEKNKNNKEKLKKILNNKRKFLLELKKMLHKVLFLNIFLFLLKYKEIKKCPLELERKLIQ